MGVTTTNILTSMVNFLNDVLPIWPYLVGAALLVVLAVFAFRRLFRTAGR